MIIRASLDGVGLVIDYVDNFATAKWEGTHLIISGDHGPHFWCWDTLMYQSTVFKKYGVSIEVCGLCSYHAYNRCDAHGAVVKRYTRQEQLRGAGPISAADFTNMVNNLPAAANRGIQEFSIKFFKFSDNLTSGRRSGEFVP